MTQTFAKLKIVTPRPVALKLGHASLKLKAQLRLPASLTVISPLLISPSYAISIDMPTLLAAVAGSIGGLLAPIASPAFTGTPTVPTAPPGTNSAQAASTAYADAIAALKANIASPTFTGVPAGPTAAANNNSTQFATTAYADAADALKAPLASPALTGTPTVPTAAPATNTTQAASTAFVLANAGSASPSLFRNFLAGLNLSTAGASVIFGIGAGVAVDSTNANFMSLPSAYTKTFAGNWSLGSGGGVLDVGSTAASSWYYPYLIKRLDTNVVDAIASLAPGTSSPFTITIASPGVVTQANHGLQVNAQFIPTTTGALPTGLVAGTVYYVKTVTDVNTITLSATQGGAVINTTGAQSGVHTGASTPTLPANYTVYRRLGALRLNGATQIAKFIQDGDLFTWDIPVNDVSATNPGTAAVTRALTVPLGVRVQAIIAAGGADNANGTGPAAVYISDLSVSDQVAAQAGAVDFFVYFGSPAPGGGIMGFMGMTATMTNTSAQVRSRVQTSVAATSIVINTRGWRDRRGQDA